MKISEKFIMLIYGILMLGKVVIVMTFCFSIIVGIFGYILDGRMFQGYEYFLFLLVVGYAGCHLLMYTVAWLSGDEIE